MARNNVSDFDRAEIFRPVVEGAETLRAEIVQKTADIFGCKTIGVAKGIAIESSNGIDEPVTRWEDITEPVAEVYDLHQLRYVHVGVRAEPRDNMSTTFNYVLGRAKEDPGGPRRRNRMTPLLPEEQNVRGRKRDKRTLNVAFSEMEKDAGVTNRQRIPFKPGYVEAVRDPLAGLVGYELVLRPTNDELVTEMIVTMDAICWRAMNAHSRRVEKYKDPVTGSIPLCRLPFEATPADREDIIEKVESALPDLLFLGRFGDATSSSSWDADD